MNRIIRVKDVSIGEGPPKVCAPMVGSMLSSLEEEAGIINELACDLVEWRVDYFSGVMSIDSVKEALKRINSILMGKPLIFTFRNKAEGGQCEIDAAYYQELLSAVMQTRLVDLVDVELAMEESMIRELVTTARKNQVNVIISSHDFNQTPSAEKMVQQMLKAAELGGDIPKLAVMPRCSADVLALMEATRCVKEDHGVGPLITMAMGGLGMISRLAGEVYGSDLTFGAAKAASAPGQIAASELQQVIQLIHQNMPAINE
ncbi:type I 3-dehydroquinate dehydratase [Anoxynatronum buryatiense]|uniref:3-dehydroquinate dehydratase n=1 Tax=Anoxynatronum buryatiense TaxID=489973 RepID=A0AA45WUS8_9CLOT|nr:type I 3-dehydroquinate dehydratase [Anoxynatronum buryatiense]SMP48626.1 3-dehydroquinate dehydratase [Anoxynatronum buryatiense]